MNLPNRITVLRVLLIPAFLLIYLAQPFGPGWVNDWLALVLFSVAAITDAFDGYYARKLNLVTNFGKLMDPLADKLLVGAAIIAFTASGSIPAWAVIIMISREFYISGLRMLALEQKKVLAATGLGKFKTIAQITMIIYILLPIHFLVFQPVITILIILSVITSVISAWDYTTKNLAVFEKLD
ncbi:MAG: CDP-diacylglycerol--glycerol-3-phosphate 3-phosphatidyltransferase [Defluviitaleaceae bacterium]|nr:CDP-diacylglycerol--glycerol-3-phosphate 3-phosphatidyltransferase [Defluviitaleaceae bacterium]